MLKAALLANIHMAQASEHWIPITHVKYFEPDDRKGVCVSLEEWGAKIFEPDIPQILHDAKKADKQTKIWFECSKKSKGHFSFTGEDHSKNVKEGGTTKRMGEEQAQVWEHLTTVHQINTKDSQERSCSSISAGVLNSF